MLHQTHGGHGALWARVEQEDSAHGVPEGVMFSLKSVKFLALGIMGVAGGPPPARGPCTCSWWAGPGCEGIGWGPHATAVTLRPIAGHAP